VARNSDPRCHADQRGERDRLPGELADRDCARDLLCLPDEILTPGWQAL
jgi:hypothetical protein